MSRLSWLSCNVLSIILAALLLGPARASALTHLHPEQSEIDGDRIDNDGDGYIDSADTECGSHYVGYGSKTVGGAGGQVFWVDCSLGDPVTQRRPVEYSDSHAGTFADPCTLRKALDGGNRVVKFVNGGTITLQAPLGINNPNVTVDGFSAPAPGVTITYTPEGHGGITIGPRRGEHSHDVILNHIRFDGLYEQGFQHRLGWGLLGMWAGNPQSSLSNVIVDHVTLRDNQDKFTIWGQIDNVTLSNCFFYHSGKALLISFYFDKPHDTWAYDLARKNLSVYHNIFAENDERNPQLRGWIENLDFADNIIYGWGGAMGMTRWGYGMRVKSVPGEHPIDANIVNNFYTTQTFNPGYALIYGVNPGADAEDGGPPEPLPQGAVLRHTKMGQLWVAGNILPRQNEDQYSTIPKPLPTPGWAALPAVRPAELYLSVPQAGMQYKDARDINVLGRVMRDTAPSFVIGRHVAAYTPPDEAESQPSEAEHLAQSQPAAQSQPLAGSQPTTTSQPTTRPRRGSPAMTGVEDVPPYQLADKTPLMPTQIAGPANITTDPRGITCILIDAIAMEGNTSAADFDFKIGTSGVPAKWRPAPAPTVFSSRERGGVLGADRFLIAWPDGAIANTYLQVTVKATDNTHLSRDEVFYFGNFTDAASAPAFAAPAAIEKPE